MQYFANGNNHQETDIDTGEEMSLESTEGETATRLLQGKNAGKISIIAKIKDDFNQNFSQVDEKETGNNYSMVSPLIHCSLKSVKTYIK